MATVTLVVRESCFCQCFKGKHAADLRNPTFLSLIPVAHLSFLAFWLCSSVCADFWECSVVFTSVIYGPCLWMAALLGPLRERAPWTSKEPRQLSSAAHSSAGLCWARRNLGADLVILPLWNHWNCACSPIVHDKTAFTSCYRRHNDDVLPLFRDRAWNRSMTICFHVFGVISDDMNKNGWMWYKQEEFYFQTHTEWCNMSDCELCVSFANQWQSSFCR